MSAPKVGALFAGYGGMELALHDALGAEPAWFCEVESGPSRILAHHWPDVPNHGDVTAVDWSSVEPVDIIAGGSPCQDVSHAGKRAGMKAGTRSGLWSAMCDAIETIRPGLVVWENVRGVLSAEADSALEPCAGCVGDGDDGPVLRALGRVLGDLAELGFDAEWVGLRAADVGACHGRFREFVIAWPAADTSGHGRFEGWAESARLVRGLDAPLGRNANGMSLLPTPAVNDMGRAYTPDEWDAWTARMRAAHGNGNWHGKSLSIELLLNGLAAEQRFGDYAPAIARWETVLDRVAPAPTEPTGKGGAHRLSPAFVEWMQGIPDGHVTDPAIGLSRNEQLKALGNGVVPQQAAAAVLHLLARAAAEVAA